MEDYELCKQLTELTGWQGPFDTDYLLTKLPREVGKDSLIMDYGYMRGEDVVRFVYGKHDKYIRVGEPLYEAIAVTPKTALLKLAIELAKAGVIGKEGE